MYLFLVIDHSPTTWARRVVASDSLGDAEFMAVAGDSEPLPSERHLETRRIGEAHDHITYGVICTEMRPNP